jgi:cyclophilin family peptidyl-prolyl cis-trans isomerase
MRVFLFLLFLNITVTGLSQKHVYASIETDYGTMIIKLANETPRHRDNFIRLVQEGYFDTTVFHRVVPGFVIQGGDPDSLFITPSDTTVLKTQRLLPEFHPSLFHKKGAFCMGRDDNLLQASFFTQFYIVQGRTYTDSGLDSLEQFRMKGRKINPERREVYKSKGGIPRLDEKYTVLGEVVQGLDVVDSISNVMAVSETPVKPVRMKIKLLNKRKAQRLENKLKNLENKK